MLKSNNQNNGFTLIELLIVVAIIAILAAIAIPNFLAAQVRAKVSRIKGEFATIATAMESYYVDNNAYPWPKNGGNGPNNFAFNFWTWEGVSPSLSSPISYINQTAIIDPFKSFLAYGRSYRMQTNDELLYMKQNYGESWWTTENPVGDNVYNWYNGSQNSNLKWDVWSSGPDQIDYQYFYYDPSNGTVSPGEIIRFGP